MEMVTQKCHENFKLKPYLNDGSGMNRCYCSRAQKGQTLKKYMNNHTFTSEQCHQIRALS